MPFSKRSCYGFDITNEDIDRRIEAIELDHEDRRKTSVFLTKKRNSYKGHYTLSDVANKYQNLNLFSVALNQLKAK